MKSQYRSAIEKLPLGSFRYYHTIGSTNDVALEWASQDAPDLSLIIADEQTSGRGRMDRQWFTPPNSALAMSLILRPTRIESAHPSRATGLLAVSLTKSLIELGLNPQIKWPNDILLTGRKVAGILVELVWTGTELDALVLGMGVNVLSASVLPSDQLLFPATCIEAELKRQVERADLLKDILINVTNWRSKLGTAEFLKTWEANLAFRGQQVQVEERNGKTITGEIIGLEPDGSLCLRNMHGKSEIVHFGEVHLRPVA